MQSDVPGAFCGGCATDVALPRQVAWLQWITLAWMALECGASLWAAAQSHSVALLAFGSDSLVEMLSATVVLLQFLPRFPLNKVYADRAAAVLVVCTGSGGGVHCVAWARAADGDELCRHRRYCAGAGGDAGAGVVETESGAANEQSRAGRGCYAIGDVRLSGWRDAGGARIYAVWQIRWVDTVAALAAVPLLIVEGRRAWRGEGADALRTIAIFRKGTGKSGL